MSRIRVALGLAAVAAGSAWFATRAGGLRASGQVLLDAAPYAVVLAGVLLLLRAAAPKGAMAGPLLVILAGGAWLAIDRGAFATGSPGREQFLPAALILLGAVVAFVPVTRDSIDTGVRRVGTVLLPRDSRLSGKSPLKLVVYAIFSSVTVDLTRMRKPHRIEIDHRVLCGRIVLVLPQEWMPLVSGRLAWTPGVRFDAFLDTEERPDKKDPEVLVDAIGFVGAVRIRRVASKPAAPAQNARTTESQKRP